MRATAHYRNRFYWLPRVKMYTLERTEKERERGEERGERHSEREEWRMNRGGREKKGNDVKKNRGSRGVVGGGQGEDKKEAERERKPLSTAVAGQEA